MASQSTRCPETKMFRAPTGTTVLLSPGEKSKQNLMLRGAASLFSGGLLQAIG